MAVQHPLTLVTPVLKEKYSLMYDILRELSQKLEEGNHHKFKSFDTM